MKARVAFVCLVFLFGCGKENQTGALQKLSGKWELRKIEYGYSVQPVFTYEAGNGNVISFSGNQYTRTDITGNDTVVASGSYRISGSNTCDSKTVTVIDFSGDYNSSSVLTEAGDSLYFASDSCVITDGYERTYIKTGN